MFFATYQILRLSWMNGKSVARCCLSMLPRNSGVQQVRHSGVPTFKMSTLSIFHDPDTNTFLHWSMDGCKTSTELCFVYIILYNYIHYIFFIEWLNDMRCMFSKKAKIRDVPQPLAFPSMTQTQVAISHSAGALLSLGALRIGGHDILVTGCWVRLLPGSLAHFRTWIGSMVMTNRDKSSDLPTRQGAWSTASS